MATDLSIEQQKAIALAKARQRQAQEKPSAPETLATQALQGASFGFFDEAQAGVAAPVVAGLKTVTGQPTSIPEAFSDIRNIQSEKLSEQQEERPVLSTASQITGALTTGALGGTTATGTRLANFIRNLPKAKRAGALGLGGLLSGGAFGFGTAEGDAGERAKEAAPVAAGAAAISAALPVVGPVIGKAVTAPAERIINKQLVRKGVDTGIDAANPELAFGAAINQVRRQADKVAARTSKRFSIARTRGKNTFLDKRSVIPKIGNKITDKLDEDAIFLEEEGLGIARNFRDQLTKISKESGDSVNLNRLEKWRRGVTRNANRATDPNLKSALTQMRNAYDEVVEEGFEDAVLTGDDRAVKAWARAIKSRRDQGAKLGTARGQSPVFEKIFTKNELDNGQLVDTVQAIEEIFGKTTAGKNNTSQIVRRMLANSGPDEPVVRQNLRDGFLFRAIRKSFVDGEGGERLVAPDRLKTELNRLLRDSRDIGGLGADLRDSVFTKQELNAIADLRNNLTDPRNFFGAVRRFGSRIPLLSDAVGSAQVISGRATRKQIEEFLTDFALKAQPQLKGQSTFYGGLIVGEQPAISESLGKITN